MGARGKKVNYRNCPGFGQVRAMIKTGTYVGNGVNNRDIDIGVNLAAKNNVFVMIKSHSDTAYPAFFRTEYGQGDLSDPFDPLSSPIPDVIQSFTATGFQIGANSIGNQNTKTHIYVAIWEEPF